MLEQFACLMFGYSRESSINSVRGNLLRKMVGDDKKLTSKSKVDLARLPPCAAALKPHNQRVNHHVSLYKHAHESIVEKPQPHEEGQGRKKNDDDLLEPIWSCEPILPSSLVDILESGSLGEDEIDEELGNDYYDSDDIDSDVIDSDDDEFP